jgi:hypothetical protein
LQPRMRFKSSAHPAPLSSKKEKYKMATQEEIIVSGVNDVLALESNLAVMEAELAQNEQFRAFLIKQKEAKAQIDDFWKSVEEQMIEHDVKSVKGDWGTLTIAERLNWETTDELPSKFYKKVVDTKKISDTYRLEGKAPKGATPSTTKYLMKRIKAQMVNEIVKGTSN